MFPLHSSQDMWFDMKFLGGKALESMQEKFKKLCPGKNQEEGVNLLLAEAMASPRILACHYSLPLLPKDILDRIKVT